MDQGYDPEDPPCARCVLSGDFEKLTDEDEIAFAKEGLFAKHPKMRTWPESHDFYFGKIVPTSIWLINIYGGATDVDMKKYFAVTDAEIDEKFASA
mmetsp:Transcript_29129/g.93209  ORF Transcript_29129/g.93209 Transcript_29129/m.93209 type:complete len:96 (-) Transcript_29129:71-358(-)